MLASCHQSYLIIAIMVKTSEEENPVNLSYILFTPVNTCFSFASCNDQKSLCHPYHHSKDNWKGKALKSVKYLFAIMDIIIGGKPSKLSTCFSPPFTHLPLSIASAAQFEKFSKPVKILNWLPICSAKFSLSPKIFDSGLWRDGRSSYN